MVPNTSIEDRTASLEWLWLLRSIRNRSLPTLEGAPKVMRKAGSGMRLMTRWKGSRAPAHRCCTFREVVNLIGSVHCFPAGLWGL